VNLTALRARLTELQSDIATLAEIENISDEDNTRLESMLEEFTTVQADEAKASERAAKIEAVRSAEVVVETGDGAKAAEAVRASFSTIVRPSADDVFDVRSLDRLDGREYRRTVIDHALRAIETGPFMTDSHREVAEGHARTSTKRDDKARYILEHGSPEYHEAFQDYLENPALGPHQGRADRAALSLTGANGGYLVPFTLDPTVILTNNGATNPFRSIAKQVSITTDDWNGVTSAGVTAEWIAEATEVADGSPTFSQPTITPKKADAYIQASLEVVADSGVSGEISMLIADAKDRLEAAAFATGSGSGQPFGIVTALNLVTASRVAGSSGAAGAADFVLADVYALSNALPPRHRPNSSWLAEQSTYNRVRRFGEGTTSNAAFWADLGVGTPSQLLGRPVYESSEMDSTIVSGSNDNILVLGDFRKYQIVDRMGLELVYNPLVLGSNRRPTGEVAWVAFWRVGGRAVDANAFRMLRL
jgi:HK97 family phage major capsid protein